MTDRCVRVFLLLAVCSVLAGCAGGSSTHFGAQSGSAPVTMSMTDTPPAGVSPLSLEVTFTGATLNPGNRALLAAPVTVDLARLQTETSLLTSANVVPGTYTSLTLTIAANPSLTFQNNTGAVLAGCANGAICTTGLTTPVTSQSVNFPGAGITLASNTPAALLVDMNLSTVLTNTLALDMSVNGAVTPSQIVPPQGLPFEALEDVVGVVSTPVNGAFVLQTALGNYNITTDSNTKYLNFPVGVCSPVGFACIQAGEILSVNMNLLTSNTLVATDIFFEDANSTLPEIEGIVVGTSVPGQFSMVVLQESPAGIGPALGSLATVTLSAAPATPFQIDNLVGLVNYTGGLSFASPSDLIVSQEVQVQQGTGSAGSVIKASRVQLRSSRITGTVASIAGPNISVNALPSFLTNASPAINQIAVETATTFTPHGTEFGGTNTTNLSNIAMNKPASVRGQLFANTGNPKLLATRVVQNN